MSEYREKLDGDLLKNLEIVDAALAQLKASPLLENQDFDLKIVHDGYIRATLKPSSARIGLVVEVYSLGIQIHIDRIDEARWWEGEYLNKPQEIQRDIQILLGNSLYVTHKIGFAKIEAKNSSGECLLTMRRFIGFRAALSFLPITRKIIYLPLYSVV